MTGIKSQQSRSQKTLSKLIDAFYQLLQDKYFEQISIKEITSLANVAVGTFYRRIENKEALLPAVYEKYHEDMAQWTNRHFSPTYWRGKSVKELSFSLVADIYHYFKSRRGIIRTLHLYSRLNPNIVSAQQTQERLDQYKNIEQVIANLLEYSGHKHPEKKANMVSFLILSCIIERVLYPDITPSLGLSMSDKQFTSELSNVVFTYIN
ncbi:TetR/AcrR family transcriptional regulator [Aliikangiella coralliicola]|uniref:TetR/AcrR family transcriptional regulator n=1 Tax=Aliikangiella coralliicola TaxID=2592383 RepID=A0A545UC67_9GAMM|nr:TetR/AcrR family transcriptional regulator [Aliikangiella coralliicola]TQV87023.1 TetR/AcrR family transcriptional regulator [Aliikangiella coralliicola]